MRGPRRYLPTGTSTARVASALVILTLLLGCDTASPPESTPIAPVSSTLTPTAGATPTTAALAPTVPPSTPTESTAEATPTLAGARWSSTVNWRGGSWYLLGVNYPYYHYGNDFGDNDWGTYVVHDPKTY